MISLLGHVFKLHVFIYYTTFYGLDSYLVHILLKSLFQFLNYGQTPRRQAGCYAIVPDTNLIHLILH